jgi:hypothetical protein
MKRAQDRAMKRPVNVKVFCALEHDPEKWKPVFGQDHAQTNNLDRDPIQSNCITV